MDKKIYFKLRKSIDSTPNPFELIKHGIIDLFLIGLSVFFSSSTDIPHLGILSIPILSTLMFRNFSLMHDATHSAVSKNKTINTYVGVWSGGICFLPFSSWKVIHQEHHFWSGNIDHDPSMSLLKKLPHMNSKLISFFSQCWKLWIPIMALLQHISFWGQSVKIGFKNPKNLQMHLSVIAPILFWGSMIYFSKANFLINTFIPSLWMYLIAVEIVNFPHHLQMPQLQGKERLPTWDQHFTARSCNYPRWFSKYIVLNFNLHIEHHLFPDLPWYKLNEIQDITKNILQEHYNTDTNLNWNLENRSKDLLKMIQASKFNSQMNKESIHLTKNSISNVV